MSGARSTLGLDLGFAQDFTAMAAVDSGPARSLRLRGITRFPLGTQFRTVVSVVAQTLLKAPPETLLCVDSGGLGRPVVEYLRDEIGREARRCIGVQITSGLKAQRRSPLEWSVPKFDLVRAVQVAIETKRLIIPPGAEVVSIKEFLGHASIASSERYAKLSNLKVKQVYLQAIAKVISKTRV